MTLEAIVAVLVSICALLSVTSVEGAPPWLGIGLSLLELALRPLIALSAALLALVYLPQAGSFAVAASSRGHTDLPLVGIHLSFGGHLASDLIALTPLVAVAGAVGWACLGAARDAVGTAGYLRAHSASGPGGSVLVKDESFVLAATVTGPKNVLISTGAIALLDSSELAGALAHERAHLRRHRLAALVGTGLARAGLCLPGTQAAYRQLRFSFERDADAEAIHETGDPHALASAICKGRLGGEPRFSMSLRGDTSTGARVRALVEQQGMSPPASFAPPATLLPGFVAALSACSLVWTLSDSTGLVALKRLAALCASA